MRPIWRQLRWRSPNPGFVLPMAVHTPITMQTMLTMIHARSSSAASRASSASPTNRATGRSLSHSIGRKYVESLIAAPSATESSSASESSRLSMITEIRVLGNCMRYLIERVKFIWRLMDMEEDDGRSSTKARLEYGVEICDGCGICETTGSAWEVNWTILYQLWDASVLRFDRSLPRGLRGGTLSRASPCVSFSTNMRSSRPKHDIAASKLLYRWPDVYVAAATLCTVRSSS
jgi:hypothetical protein